MGEAAVILDIKDGGCCYTRMETAFAIRTKIVRVIATLRATIVGGEQHQYT
jgi:hypothetical protein